MSKVAVFTDASRVDLGGSMRSTYGWVAVDFENPETSLAHTSVHVTPQKWSNSTVHSELLAVYYAAKEFSQMDEIHIFTDSLYASEQIDKAKLFGDNRRRPLRVFPELIIELSLMRNVHVHHLNAHKSYFFNELVDQMVRMVAFDEMSIEEAENWGRKTCRSGTVEIIISKTSKPKYVRRGSSKMVGVFTQVRNA